MGFHCGWMSSAGCWREPGLVPELALVSRSVFSIPHSFPVLAPLPVTSNALALVFFVFLRSFAPIWGVTVGGALLQNELLTHIPASVQAALGPGLSDNIPYTVIPLVRGMAQPQKDATRAPFRRMRRAPRSAACASALLAHHDAVVLPPPPPIAL
ncbi:uncharacterized protein TRAVEDRAFT_52570 [Trametes versicolor FP-101664 SS1]|uniref:uncharacterized protein n=1 Tax=Trametes versicolor (strain FP-101664) TaxID=717944 RepID=UPI0004621843|nr:uncharacterized protein TRAVEDRAFT_52570 [Trametes versicolor FP-101664 SS1]EIW53440.1 hypothetical protein TRAVEDRAFT_52570 [Trametes versicolor FP-101664 SS1]